MSFDDVARLGTETKVFVGEVGFQAGGEEPGRSPFQGIVLGGWLFSAPIGLSSHSPLVHAVAPRATDVTVALLRV